MTDSPQETQPPLHPELGHSIGEWLAREGGLNATVRLGARRDRKDTERAIIGQLGRYPVEGEVGSGGMGQVLRVRDGDLGRSLAVKILHPEAGGDARFLRKFLVEGQITGQLEHPNIVPVYELGLAGDRPFIAQRLVEGLTLEVVLSLGESAPGQLHSALGLGRGLPTSLVELLDVFGKICDAISYAHSRGVIHRDLKPENVMLGRFGEVYVMDWGLARQLGGEDHSADRVEIDRSKIDEAESLVTLDGSIVGTPAYMSPEQARGEVGRLNEKSDIYCLGAILYQILTGLAPFEGDSVWRVLDQVAAGALIPPGRRAPGKRVPRELEAIVLKAMAPEQYERYDSAVALMADVRAFVEHRPVAAAQYTITQQLAIWIRRHGAALRAGALVGVIAVGAFWFVDRQERQEREAAERSAGAALLERAATLESALDRALKTEGDWFAGRDRVARCCEALIALDGLPKQRRDRARALLTSTSREAAVRANAEGRTALAMHWVQRVEEAARDALVAELRAVRTRGDQRELARSRSLIERAGAVGGDGAQLEALCAELLRGASGVTTRLLVEQVKVAEGPLGRQRLVIRALGRSGSADAVAPLVARLGTAKVLAREVVRALAALGDARAVGSLRRYRARCAPGSVEWSEALVARCALPFDASARVDTTTEAPVRAGRPADALASLERALGARPRAVMHWLALGQLCFEQGWREAGEAAFGRAIALAPDRAASWEARSVAQLGVGNPARALADADRAIALANASASASLARVDALMRLKRWSDSLIELDRAGRLTPADGAMWWRRAQIHLAEKRRTLALTALDRAIERDRGLWAAYRARAALHQHAKRWEKADEDWRRFRGHAPDDGEACLRHAVVLLVLGRAGEARAALDRAIALAPEDPRSRRVRGELLARERRYEEALADYEVALRHAPKDADLRIVRARMLLRLGRPKQALVDLDLLVAEQPDLLPARFHRAWAYRLLTRWEAAGRDLDHLLGIDDTRLPARLARAHVLRARGRLAPALVDLDWVLKREAINHEALHLRGLVKLDLGRVEAARHDIAGARRFAPVVPDYAYDMARVFAHRARVEKGAAEQRKLLERGVELLEEALRLGLPGGPAFCREKEMAIFEKVERYAALRERGRKR